MKPALLIIDLQQAYYQGPAAASMDEAVVSINKLLPAFRAEGLPVFWIHHTEEEWDVVPGKSGFEFIGSLAPRDGEKHVHKTYNNSFNKTDLAEMLKREAVDTVILAGYCAEYCVIATYWGAKGLDLEPYILRGGIASDVPRNVGLVEELTATKSREEIEALLSGAK